MENKKVTHTARMFFRLWNVGWFAMVWIYFYNDYTFQTYKFPGALFSILIYYILYTLFCDVYKAFRIASTDVGEIVFSQFVAFALSDLILYVECCLIYNQVVNILPGAAIVGIQLVGSMLISLASKRYFMKHVAARKTLVVYGNAGKREAEGLEKRLLFKYSHLFDILYTESADMPEEILRQRLAGCSTLILYGVKGEVRRRLTAQCVEAGKEFYYTPDIEDVLDMGCEPKHLLDTPIMKYEYRYKNSRRLIVKRSLDLIFAILFLVLFSPFMVLAAIAIKAEDGGPVFFRQKRYTQNGKIFEILKFRSMIVDAEKNGVQPTTGADSRITKVGKVIRSLRIDELPQLWNILKGDMSFVGPRPERIEHVELYMQQLPEFRYRLKVKGGLTGYAQVFGKYNTSAYDKLLLDLIYIENQSTLLDLKLVLLTFRTLFQKESTEGFDVETSEEINKETK